MCTSVPKQKARARKSWANDFLLNIGISICLWVAVTEAEKIREVHLDIVSPEDGARIDPSDFDDVPLLVRVRGMQLPQEGVAEILLDRRRLALMDGNELFLPSLARSGLAGFPEGEHRIDVGMLSTDGTRLGAEVSSKFYIVRKDAAHATKEGADHGFGPEGATECDVDASRSIVEGRGVQSALVGVSNEFYVHVRNAKGDLVDPIRCPQPIQFLVTINPAPLEHSLSRQIDGTYFCQWTTEYEGEVLIDIQVGHLASRLPGSPFRVPVVQTYTLIVEGKLQPKPWPFAGRMLHTSRSELHHAPPAQESDDAIQKACAAAEEQQDGMRQQGCAFVTMVTGDRYLAGALTLFFSVRRTGTSVPFVAMITSDGVSSSARRSLETAGIDVIEVARMRKRDISDMSEARWNDNYTKLRLWSLPFRKLVFIDADTVVLQPLDHLFALKASFAAVPDAFHPCYFNTGFMVIEPDESNFKAISSRIDEVSSEESEQTLLNDFYLDRFHVLHYTYNFAKHTVVSPTRFKIYIDNYMDTVKVVHFLGVKPWQCSRDRDCMRHVPYYGGESNKYLYDLWWTIFEELCDSHNVTCRSTA
jgi:hypothetical protein